MALFISKLREATKVSHQQLDHQLYPIIQSLSSTNAYGDLLAVFYGFYQPLYQRLDSYFSDEAVISDYKQRRQPSWILNDLHSLDMPATDGEICQHIPAIDNLPAALGAYYVLEGATMGGSIIAKKIAGNLGIKEDGDGLYFFSAYRENNGIMWKNFLNILEESADTEESSKKIINTAQQTFEQFGHWITAHYHKNKQDANTNS